MQDRYLGDAHDFIKYAFLRYLDRVTAFKLGLHWYRTDPDRVGDAHTGDGEKRHHLKGGPWADWDGDLLDALRPYEQPSARDIEAFERTNVLPAGLVTVKDFVPLDGRADWHRRALDQLRPCDWIFCDPDNGFEVPSATKRRRAKYATYQEVAAFVSQGAIVTSIQFARQCDPVKRGQEVRARLLSVLPGAGELPIIRCRIAPNVLYITAAPPHLEAPVREWLRGFVQASQSKTKGPVKVEILRDS